MIRDALAKLAAWSLLEKLLGVGLLVAIVLVLIFQRHQGPGTMAPAVHDSLVALDVSRKADSAAHAVTVAKAETALRYVRVADPQVQILRRAADSLRTVADSAAARAVVARTAQDSAIQWHAAYSAEHQRADSLQRETVVIAAQRDSALSAARLFAKADTTSQARLARTERDLSALRADFDRVSNCRIIPFVPCASRKVVALVGFGAGVLVARR